MLKLKLQYFGHLTQRADSLEKKKKKKTLMLGILKATGKDSSRGLDGYIASQTQWT